MKFKQRKSKVNAFLSKDVEVSEINICFFVSILEMVYELLDRIDTWNATFVNKKSMQ